MMGRKYGVQGTPSWLLGQRLITGLRSAAEFERLAEYAVQLEYDVNRSAARPLIGVSDPSRADATRAN